MKKRKWLSYTIDGVLVALIAFFGYIQISMMATKSSNFGVPMAFGQSFLYVSTESMDNPEVSDFGKGSGIIIQKVDPASLQVSNRIEDPETGKIDYDFKGDVVTFYLTFASGAGYPDTHRLIDKQLDPETGKVYLGSIVICRVKAKEQAAEYGHGEERELAYLTVHGVLHLLSFDHIEEADRAEMRAAEERVLSVLGIGRE